MAKVTLQLVVGLGNHSLPSTRHSIGMSALNRLADFLRIKWTYEKKCSGFVAQYINDSYKIFLLKPKLPMNINGKSIFKTVSQYQIKTENVILVQDDLDKPLGKIRIKLDGTASGHNGVKSTISALKTDKVKRIKIGIGRPSSKSQVVDYVLDDFKRAELTSVNRVLDNCVAMLLDELGIASYVQVCENSLTEDTS